MTQLNVKHLPYNLTLLIHITHWTKKYTRTAKAGGLNGLRSAKKKRREEFTGIEEGFN